MAWDLTGNAGTNPRTDFLGTRDPEPLVIRTGDAERLRVDTSGFVGIGRSLPADKLHVEGASDQSATIVISRSDNSKFIRLGVGTGGVAVDFDSTSYLVIQKNTLGIAGILNGAELLRVTADGLVGIGTSSPRSVVEAAVSAPGTLGPSLTVTNTGGGVNAAAAVDLNTFPPPASATYNPSSRIEAVDDGNFANDIVFLSNTPGAPNNGLVERMRIASTDRSLFLVILSSPATLVSTRPTQAPVLRPKALGPIGVGLPMRLE
jgi:hypothetical protein